MPIANPHNLSLMAAAEVEARSRLPIDHPEYIPSEACPPKLSFPEARKHDLCRKNRETTVLDSASPTLLQDDAGQAPRQARIVARWDHPQLGGRTWMRAR